MAAKDVVRILLKVAATFMFFFAGINKIHPSVSPDTFLLLDQGFRNSFMPLWQRLVFDHFEYQMSPLLFKSMIGTTEVLICVLLWLGNRSAALGSVLGIIIMIGAATTHVLLGEKEQENWYARHFTAGLAILFLLILPLSPRSTNPTK
jgi:uncharacterized membrane protein YphA (DoxX/SURF4 family)